MSADNQSALSAVEGYSYPITPLDVFQVRQMLLKLGLPVELILDILEVANYRPMLIAHRDEALEVGSYHGRSNQVGALYLTAPAVPIGNKKYNATHRVKYIEFKTESSDQGSGGDPGCPGTYNGSYAWFEATILRPSSRETAISPPNQTRLEMEFPRRPLPSWKNPLDARTSLLSLGWDLVMNDNNEPITWHVQSNLTADPKVREHEIRWERGTLARTTDEVTGESNGMGSGVNFFETFQEGDRVALWARALYPAWVNKVKSASIEIGFDELVAD